MWHQQWCARRAELWAQQLITLLLLTQNPHQLSPVELQRAVLERWLVTDIAESSLPALPSEQFTTLTNVALQVCAHRHTYIHAHAQPLMVFPAGELGA